MSRQLFATFKEASEMAEVIRTVPGWTVVEVRGDAPAGPVRTAPRHSTVVLGRRAADRVGRVPPMVVAVTPNGRRVNVGSRARFEALRADAHSLPHG